LTKVTDVIQGTLDLLILKALALNPMHGWGISDHIAQISGGVFKIGQGSMYPALHRFENRGWVISYWRQTPNNRIARLYELTPAGKHALEDEIAVWRSYTSAMDRVIQAQ
jgi:transcriptional regulator